MWMGLDVRMFDCNHYRHRVHRVHANCIRHLMIFRLNTFVILFVTRYPRKSRYWMWECRRHRQRSTLRYFN